MPDEKLNLLVTFRNAAKTGLTRFRKDIQAVDKQVSKTTSGLKSFHGQLLTIGALFAGGAFFGNSIKTFADFDDNMRAAGAVTSATTKDLERMTNVAKQLGRETRFTASNAASAFRFLGMAGLDAAEATEALPGVLNLAAAGALDLGTAADITTNVLSSFGLEVEKLGRVNDVLVKTFTSSNVDLIEFGESFKIVGSIGKGVGADFEDLSAAIGALGNAGLKGTAAGTGLKGAIDALLAPTGKEAAAMQKLAERIGQTSLNVRDSNGDFIGFAKVIEQLERAGLRGDEALQAFGLRAGPALQALLNQGSDSLEELIEKLKDAGGTADEIAKQMEAGIGGQLRQTASVLEAVGIAFGEAFGPEVTVVLTAFREYLLDVINVITELKENGDLQGIGQTVVDIFSLINTVVSKAIDAIQSFTAITIAAGAAITGNFDLAREALKGWVQETNELLGTADKFDGTVTKPITAEMNAARKALEDAAKPTGPIGKGSDKVKKSLNNVVPAVSMEAKLKAALIKLNAVLEQEAATLDSNYEQGLIKLDEYYNQRISILQKASAQERAILEEKLSNESDVDKKALLNAKLFELDKKLQTDIIGLNAERKKEQEKLDNDLLKSKQNIDRKRIAAEQVRRNQETRIREQGSTDIENQFNSELTSLQNKQQNELQTIQDYHNSVLQALRDRKASEEEIELAFQERKTAIEEQARLQKQEREQLIIDQNRRLVDVQLNQMQTLAQGTSQIFSDLYKLTGSKVKAFFYIAKAAAIAEATINIAKGITQALGANGIFGIAQGAIIAAQGAVQVAKISSQQLADGGEVKGRSPHKRADDKVIRATSGEFMMNVDSVRHFGLPFMHAINDRKLKFAFGGQIGAQRRSKAGFNTGNLSGSPESNAGKDTQSEPMPLNIVNVVDPSTLDQYLSTPEGQDAIVNVIGQRSQEVQRRIRSGA